MIFNNSGDGLRDDGEVLIDPRNLSFSDSIYVVAILCLVYLLHISEQIIGIYKFVVLIWIAFVVGVNCNHSMQRNLLIYEEIDIHTHLDRLWLLELSGQGDCLA